MTTMADGEVIYSQSEKSDFKRFFYKYLRYWYLFLISIVLFVGLAILYIKTATPKYLISSSLLIRDIDKGPDFQSGNPAFKDLDIFNSATSIENEIEALKSATLLEQVLTELSLQTSYYVDGFLKKKEIYGREVPVNVLITNLTENAYKKKLTVIVKNTTQFQLSEGDSLSAIYQFGERINKPYGSFTVMKSATATRNPPKKIYIAFNNIQDLTIDYGKELIVAQVNKKANVLTVSLTDAIPERGISIVNNLIDAYDEVNKEDRNRLATNTIGLIDDRLRDLTADLSNTEKSVEQFKRQNQVTDVRSEASAYLDESREYSKQLGDLTIQLNVLTSLEDYLSRQKDQYELVPSTLRINEPTLNELVGKFNELQLQRERMLRSAEPANPLIINISGQLANLRLNILENLRTIRRELEVTRNGLSAKVNSFQSRINRIPSIERGLSAINRQESVKRDLYVYLLQKREESALSLGATGSNTRVIDPATASKLPVDPKKPVILGLAIVLGLLLPFGFVFIRNFLSDKIQRKQDVTRVTNLPVLGEIMHHKVRKKNMVAIHHTSRTPIAEQFRLLRSNLDFAMIGKEKQVVLVTSSMQGEGKTFISINLSISLSLTGKKVVLLDCDLRKPGVLAGLGLQNDVGVSTFIDNPDLTVDNLIAPTWVADDLSVVGTGTVPLNPTEFIMQPRMAQLIAQLRERFDYIIIDSSPIGKVADAFSLAPYSDMTIFVMRYNYTPKPQLDIINDVHINDKLKHPLIVLNDARKENSYTLK